MTQTVTNAPAFIGWWRPNRRTSWTRLSDGATYDAAWVALLAALASVRGGDSLVTQADANPNGRPARRRF